jgi:hypothetical protein
MGRKSTIPKNRVYIECTNANKRVKAWVINKSEDIISVELPTGFIMKLHKRHKNGVYLFHTGSLEFISDGQLVA